MSDSPSPRRKKFSISNFLGITDLADDILNPIVGKSSIAGPLVVAVVSFINYSVSFYESILKTKKYYANANNSVKQHKTKLTTSLLINGFTATGILTSCVYFISLVAPTVLQFIEPVLPLLPGILPGIGLAISSLYLLRKSYVYHKNKNDPEAQKSAHKKLLLAVVGAVGQTMLFVGMLTMVALSGGAPIFVGAVLGACIVTIQKLLKYVLNEKNTGPKTVAVRKFLTITIPSFFHRRAAEPHQDPPPAAPEPVASANNVSVPAEANPPLPQSPPAVVESPVRAPILPAAVQTLPEVPPAIRAGGQQFAQQSLSEQSSKTPAPLLTLMPMAESSPLLKPATPSPIQPPAVTSSPIQPPAVTSSPIQPPAVPALVRKRFYLIPNFITAPKVMTPLVNEQSKKNSSKFFANTSDIPLQSITKKQSDKKDFGAYR